MPATSPSTAGERASCGTRESRHRNRERAHQSPGCPFIKPPVSRGRIGAKVTSTLAVRSDRRTPETQIPCFPFVARTNAPTVPGVVVVPGGSARRPL